MLEVSHAAAEGGKTIGFIDNGDWISFQPYRLDNATLFTAWVASAGPGGTIEIRVGSLAGTLLGSVAVPVTGSWETFTTVSTAISGAPAATAQLYLVFKGNGVSLFDVDAFTFTTGAVALKALANGRYVVAENAGASSLIANRTAIGPWEEFTLTET